MNIDRRDAEALAARKGYQLRWKKGRDDKRKHCYAIDATTGIGVVRASHYGGICQFLNLQPDLCHEHIADDTR